MLMSLRIAIAVLTLLRVTLAAASPPASPLTAEVERIAAAGGGTLGVAALHLESGRRFAFNQAESFPMASTYKVPMAVALLREADAGRVNLDEVAVVGAHLRVPSSTALDYFDHPGIALSPKNLLDVMITLSDNTATDAVLELVGGPAGVMRHLHELNISGMSVDRSVADLLRDFFRMPQPKPGVSFAEQYRQLNAEDPERFAQLGGKPNPKFDRDPKDQTTPAAMLALLEAIWRGPALSEASRKLLLDTMQATETGSGRIKGALPPGTVVAHKTGTLGGAVNDVGYITLPGGAGTVALAVFVKSSDQPAAQREAAIAHVSRALYDYFLLTIPPQ